MHSDIYWIWISRVEISAKSKLLLLKKYKNPKNIWNLKEDDLVNILSQNEVKKLFNQKYKQSLNEELNYIRKYNIKIINLYHNYYPENLKNIYDAPVCLYAIGNIHRLKEKSIAIVGTRKCSEYGKTIAFKSAYELSQNNINIISGLAKGIDTYAHMGAGERTIAVLGSGLNILYPSENIKLAKRIINKGGLIISEYGIGVGPERLHFPNRNRIISGISSGVIVVEAKKRSGSLITADFALEQGKDVFAVPGNITSINSEGTNNLIKEGAIPYTGIEDVLNI